MVTAVLLATSCASPNTGAEAENNAKAATEAAAAATAAAETPAAEETTAAETAPKAAETTAAAKAESKKSETTAAAETSTEETTAAEGTTAAETPTEAETAEADTASEETAAETEATTSAESVSAESPETAAAPAAVPSEYHFVGGGVTVTMGAEVAPILAALGDPTDVFEQESCAYQGMARVYTYPGFEISTSPVNNIDCVESVYIFDASISTPEGIRIGSTKTDVLSVYGDAYNTDEAQFGTYTYTAGNTQLKVYTTKDVVDGIEYIVIP